jgi:D-amino-acid oxidase
MDRRRFLKMSGAALAGGGLGGCAPVLGGSGVGAGPSVTLAPVLVSWDRVIRTTVGLRPHRPSGFVVRADRYDEKTVIHDYGHGGAGMSLAWGTAHLAADLAMPHPERRAAVIGCGIVGLTAARVLQRRGFDVSIYARDLPPYTTSNMSWAGFTPNSGLVSIRTPEWDAQFRRAVEIAYHEHQLLAGRDYGVSWIYEYSPTNNPRGPGSGSEAEDRLLPAGVETGIAVLGLGRHPFTTRYALRRPTLRFEPSIYLDALMRDVILFGGRIEVRAFDTPRDLYTLDESVIVNCTGLGAKQLFGDAELMPVKGQLTVLVPQPEVDYSVGGMLPRRDGIVLGHVQQRGVWSMDVDIEEQNRVMENAMRTFSSFRVPGLAAASSPDSLAFSPPPVEAFFDLVS